MEKSSQNSKVIVCICLIEEFSRILVIVFKIRSSYQFIRQPDSLLTLSFSTKIKLKEESSYVALMKCEAMCHVGCSPQGFCHATDEHAQIREYSYIRV